MKHLLFRKGLLLALALIFLTLPGCDDSMRKVVVGPNEDVSLFSDFPTGDDRNNLVREWLTKKVPTPVRDEQPYQVEKTDSLGFKIRDDWRNLVFLADMNSQSWSAKICRSAMGQERVSQLTAMEAGHILTKDLWANGQTVLFVHARNTSALSDYLAESGADIIATFDNQIIEGLKTTIFVDGEQETMSGLLEREFGYRISIPKHFVVEQQLENRFLRVKYMMPSGAMVYLFIYHHQRQSDPIDPRFCVALRDTLAARYSHGDRVTVERTTVKESTFLGRDCLTFFGHFQNNNPPMGGPFRSFCFNEGDRMYMIDLSVFNPAGRKLSQLRTLEAIARTFTTSNEKAQPD